MFIVTRQVPTGLSWSILILMFQTSIFWWTCILEQAPMELLSNCLLIMKLFGTVASHTFYLLQLQQQFCLCMQHDLICDRLRSMGWQEVYCSKNKYDSIGAIIWFMNHVRFVSFDIHTSLQTTRLCKGISVLKQVGKVCCCYLVGQYC